MRRLLGAISIVLLPLLLTSGCGESAEAPAGSTTTQTIEVTFADGTVTPNGERVTVQAGKAITFVIKAQEPGTLHVHSSPEQQLEYAAGTTTLKITIDAPGVVDVEAHNPDKTIVQLEVR